MSELTNYLEQARQHGQTDEQIRQALLAAGWNPEQINNALGETPTSPSIESNAVVGMPVPMFSPSFWRKHKYKLISTVASVLVVVLLIAVSLFGANYKLFRVYGPGMLPTLKQGQRILAAKHFGNIQRGDIIIFNSPKKLSTGISLLRVIALPGERITINKGNVLIYNSSHPKGLNPDVGYLPNGTTTPGSIDTVVPKDEVYALGDNRSDAYDSRAFGPVPISNVSFKEVRTL